MMLMNKVAKDYAYAVYVCAEVRDGLPSMIS
jgi:hypothetical protein